jgi:hypothetical protein
MEYVSFLLLVDIGYIGEEKFTNGWLFLFPTLALRIHDEIERGDNDSVKVGGKNIKVDKACSS